ncbi:two-component system response regulator CreB [Variovorax sp.]|uniref:two-component system response regulator CreB n=1 Tax=Variovorax sp. TaxID=1871043 RepID=UPI002D29349B|nr:two-component system response regulator CreB [Variovorax sp.]HYP82454.1 two-component system response regulator CreB [Variovorax sp.]
MSFQQRVLIAEDESGIADTLQYVLKSDGFVPVWCATAQQALESFAAAPPAIAILDVGLPDMNGFELFKRLQAMNRAAGGPEVPMLFLTARNDEIDRVVGLELGADDYIAKPFSPRELLARVRTILRRSALASPAGAAQPAPASPPPAAAPAVHGHGQEPRPAPLAVDDERRQIRYYGQVLDLSRYEYGLLRQLVQRPGRVFTRDELLALVWDQASESFDRTVDAHVKTLRAKLREIAPGVEAIRTLRGMGYALAEDLPATAQ